MSKEVKLKEAQSITLKANDEQVLVALTRFLAQAEGQMINFIDQTLRNNGYGATDTVLDIDLDNLVFSVTSKPEDKGDVLVVEENALIEIPYSEVNHEEFYGYVQDGRMIIMQKFTGDDEVDNKVSPVKNLKFMKAELQALPENYAKFVEMRKAQLDELESEKEDEVIDEVEEVEISGEEK